MTHIFLSLNSLNSVKYVGKTPMTSLTSLHSGKTAWKQNTLFLNSILRNITEDLNENIDFLYYRPHTHTHTLHIAHSKRLCGQAKYRKKSWERHFEIDISCTQKIPDKQRKQQNIKVKQRKPSPICNWNRNGFIFEAAAVTFDAVNAK